MTTLWQSNSFMDLSHDDLNTNANQTSIRQVVKNSLFNSGAWGVNFGLSFLATPFIVYKLTVEGYGIYALLTSLVGFYNLMDLGIGQGVTKFIAEYKAKDDHYGVNQSINSALWIQVITGAAASLGLAIFARPILELLHVSPTFYADSLVSLYVSAVGFFFMMIADTLSAVLMGLQRYDLTSSIGAGVNIALTVLIVLALLLGYGLKEVMLLTVTSGLILTVIYSWLIRWLLPVWRVFRRVDRAYLWKLFRFSAYLFISKISNLFSTYIVQFVIGFYLGPAMVTYYVVPSKLIGAIGSLLGGSFAVLFPFASELGSLLDKAKIQKLFLNGSRLFVALSMPLFLTLFVAARPILTLWLGPEFAEKGWIILGLLALASMCGALSTVPNLVTMGLGHSKVIGIYSLLNIVMYVICLPLFTVAWGIEGTAWAMLFVSLPSLALIAYQAKNIIHVPVRTYLRTVMNFHLIPFTASLGLGLLIARFTFTSTIVASLVPIIYCGSYFGIMIVFGIIPYQEWVKRIRGKIIIKASESL